MKNTNQSGKLLIRSGLILLVASIVCSICGCSPNVPRTKYTVNGKTYYEYE